MSNQSSGRQSLTLRLTLLFATVSTSVLLLLGLLIGALAERHFVEQDHDLLSGKLELIAHLLAQVRTPGELNDLPRRLDDALIGHHDLAVLLLAPDGAALFATPDAEFPAALLKTGSAEPSAHPTAWKDGAGRQFRGMALHARTGIENAPPALAAVATNISHHQHFMGSFRTTLWSVVGLAALATGLLGWVAARRGLAPLQAIRQGAAGITARRLDYRLPLGAVPAELAELAETLNAMLARLESSFQRLSDFSSDLAHELRTPVSNLLTQTQVTLSRSRDAEEYREVLASNAEELERMARMIADMLFLAQSENGLIIPEREPIDLAAEVGELFEFYEALAEEKRIALSREGQGLVTGDRIMLRRAISNLLSNAIRHTPPAGWIRARLGTAVDGRISLSIANAGTPIPAEHLPRLFDRFFRADASRRRASDGAGLGLAITRSILAAHGGEVRASAMADANVFEMILPAAESARPSAPGR
ncbi:heavy metal sensor histidine kinase [Denitratisoma sp. DHT3]|uniref:heavy metal sensor histidine kinase n=1 Tax=Denitratisoma sp. DHT3 TaxID=1981880 RepID=UPI0021BD66B0|nr:heavy metal sensor histidine kinase [Denitratisoma sp. DHT3]